MLELPRLRALRLRLALTQEELADKAGVGAATIIRIEQGQQKARQSTARKLATALGVTPADLMMEEDRGKEAA